MPADGIDLFPFYQELYLFDRGEFRKGADHRIDHHPFVKGTLSAGRKILIEIYRSRIAVYFYAQYLRTGREQISQLFGNRIGVHQCFHRRLFRFFIARRITNLFRDQDLFPVFLYAVHHKFPGQGIRIFQFGCDRIILPGHIFDLACFPGKFFRGLASGYCQQQDKHQYHANFFQHSLAPPVLNRQNTLLIRQKLPWQSSSGTSCWQFLLLHWDCSGIRFPAIPPEYRNA